MSGESAVGVALGGAVVLAATGLVAARAVSLPMSAVLTAIGNRTEASMARRLAAECAEMAWEAGARAVVERHARIRLLARHASGDSDVLGALPTPCDVSGMSLDAMAAWCTEADDRLRTSSALLDRAGRRRLGVALDAALGLAVPPGRPRAGSSAGHGADAEQRASVGRVLAVVPPGATDREGTEVAAAAGAALAAADGPWWPEELRRLRRTVAGVSSAVRRREADAMDAARYLEALVDDPGGGPLAARLTAVLDGAALDDDLRAEARDRVEDVRRRLEQEYIRARLVSTLTDLGYVVDTGFTTADAAGLRVAKARWSEHTVGLRIEAGQVHSAVMRTEGREGEDARRVDREREQEWCETVDRLRDALRADGVEAEVTSRVPPGRRTLPITRRRRTTAPRPSSKGRTRER